MSSCTAWQVQANTVTSSFFPDAFDLDPQSKLGPPTPRPERPLLYTPCPLATDPRDHPHEALFASFEFAVEAEKMVSDLCSPSTTLPITSSPPLTSRGSLPLAGEATISNPSQQCSDFGSSFRSLVIKGCLELENILKVHRQNMYIGDLLAFCLAIRESACPHPKHAAHAQYDELDAPSAETRSLIIAFFRLVSCWLGVYPCLSMPAFRDWQLASRRVILAILRRVPVPGLRDRLANLHDAAGVGTTDFNVWAQQNPPTQQEGARPFAWPTAQAHCTPDPQFTESAVRFMSPREPTPAPRGCRNRHPTWRPGASGADQVGEAPLRGPYPEQQQARATGSTTAFLKLGYTSTESGKWGVGSKSFGCDSIAPASTSASTSPSVSPSPHSAVEPPYAGYESSPPHPGTGAFVAPEVVPKASQGQAPPPSRLHCGGKKWPSPAPQDARSTPRTPPPAIWSSAPTPHWGSVDGPLEGTYMKPGCYDVPMRPGPALGLGPLGPAPLRAPLGPRPVGPGPLGPGPLGPGPLGPGPLGPGPLGPGPLGPGPLGPGPLGPGSMSPGPLWPGPLGPGSLRSGSLGPGPLASGPLGPGSAALRRALGLGEPQQNQPQPPSQHAEITWQAALASAETLCKALQSDSEHAEHAGPVAPPGYDVTSSDAEEARRRSPTAKPTESDTLTVVELAASRVLGPSLASQLATPSPTLGGKQRDWMAPKDNGLPRPVSVDVSEKSEPLVSQKAARKKGEMSPRVTRPSGPRARSGGKDPDPSSAPGRPKSRTGPGTSPDKDLMVKPRKPKQQGRLSRQGTYRQIQRVRSRSTSLCSWRSQAPPAEPAPGPVEPAGLPASPATAAKEQLEEFGQDFRHTAKWDSERTSAEKIKELERTLDDLGESNFHLGTGSKGVTQPVTLD